MENVELTVVNGIVNRELTIKCDEQLSQLLTQRQREALAVFACDATFDVLQHERRGDGTWGRADRSNGLVKQIRAAIGESFARLMECEGPEPGQFSADVEARLATARLKEGVLR
jgi:hypothetical protein